MSDTDQRQQMDALQAKLDIVVEEIEFQRRYRRDMEDLRDDLMRVGRDVYQTAVMELDGVHDQFRTVDLLHLGKKVLRNIDTIAHVVEQMESIRDFLDDAAPLAKDSFLHLMAKLDEYDRNGYFEFLREFGKAMDNIVTSFSVEDVRKLGENIVTILNTVKNLTQPEVLQSINNAVNVYKKLDINVSGDVGAWTLMKQLNSPDTRRGLAFAITFLKNVANQQPQSVPLLTTQ